MKRQSGNRSWFLLTLLLTLITWAASNEALAAPELHIEPSPVEFGSVGLYDGFSTATITISNIGDETLEFGPEGIVLSGSTAFSFVDPPSTAPLETQTSRTFLLKFDPVIVKSNSATLLFYTNEPIYYPKYVTLRGTGLAARVSVTADSLEFSHKVITEQPSLARTITVRNTGNLPLDFTGQGIFLTGADADDFVFEEPPSTTTLPAESTSNTRGLQVSFKPLSVGEKNAQVVITTTDIAQPTVTLELSGLALSERETTFHGPYNGHGPGESTIGDGGDFESLFEACMAVNDTPLTGGDWTFRIVSDLVEENNSFLGQPETNGNTITFRPALNTTTTVTFTTTTWMYGGYGAPGHFLIGEQYNREITVYTPTIPIHNVVIDGSQTPGGSDISLFFRREDLPGSCPVIFIYGGCKDITIRNCNIFTDAGESRTIPYWRTPIPIYIHTQTRPNNNSSLLLTERITIEGCALQTVGTYASPEILYLGPAAHAQNWGYDSYVKLVDLLIRDNQILTNGCGVEVLSPLSAIIDNNHVTVKNTTSGAPMAPVINTGSNPNVDISTNPSTRTSIAVTNNKIDFQPGSLGSHAGAAIGVANRSLPGTYVIGNNIISGLETSADPSSIRAGVIVYAAKETTAVIAHNSIHLNASPNLPFVGKTYGIGTDSPYWLTLQNVFHPDSHISVHNNIIHVEQKGASAIHQEGTTGTFISDNNVLSVVPGAYTSTWNQIGSQGWLETHATLDDRRTTTGQDMNSVSVNPFEPVSAGLGTWTRAAETGGDDGPAIADLHFTNYPGSVYLAPKIDGLDTDIDGDPRSEAMAIMGADEVPHHRSVVDGWGIY